MCSSSRSIANTPANWLFGISPEGIGSVGMVLNFVVANVVARVTQRPPQEVQDMVEVDPSASRRQCDGSRPTDRRIPERATSP